MTPELAIGDVLSGVRREIERNAVRARNGIRYVAGEQWAPVGPTPSEVVWSEGKAALRHYRSDHPPRLGPPVIAFGGLVGRAYIFDLIEGNSFVARLMEGGFDAFVLDWGEPDEDDAANTLETYLRRYLPRAIDAVLGATGAEELSVIGYCMGGTLALHGLPADPELPIRNLVTMATPVDFSQLNPLVDTLRDGRLDAESVLDDSGNVPADLVYSFFKITKPTADLVQYANLWQNLWNDEYMEGYQALSRCFRDQVPLAGAAFLQIADQWMRANAFVNGSLQLAGRRVALGSLRMPVLIVIGTRDELIPQASSIPLVGLLTGTRPEVMRLDAGHASLTTGRTAAKVTVPQILEWLADHSEAA